MAAVTFDGVGKVYRDGTRAVQGLDLAVGDGEFMVLVGPSGCGKTTALRMVAGLEDVTEGEIRIGDKIVNRLEPRDRDIAMVFQNYALYPHMSVYRNIAFGLRLRKVPKERIRAHVDEIARVLGIGDLLDRKPRQLSGGQRQRVAMGRAIVREPQAFLMDEPLSNLDAKLRVQMRAEIARIQREIGATTIYVTHDQIEAMTMGDRVAVMRKGELQQVAAPQELYERPANLFVASFIGSPAMNFVEAAVERENGSFACRIGDQRLRVPEAAVEARPALAGYVGRTVALGIRPEHLEDAAVAQGAGEGSRLRGRVRVTEMLGSEFLAHVDVDAQPVVTPELLEVAYDTDQAELDELRREAREHRAAFVARFDTASPARSEAEVEMAVRVDKLQFFDLETGRAIIREPGRA